MRSIHSYQCSLVQIFWKLNRSIPYPQSLWPHTLPPTCVYSNKPLDWQYTSWKTWCATAGTQGHSGKGSPMYPSPVMPSFTTRCSQILSLTGRDFELSQMSRNVAIYLAVAKKKKSGLATSPRGSEIEKCLSAAAMAQKQTQCDALITVVRHRRAFSTEAASQKTSKYARNKDVGSERLKHHNEKGSRGVEGFSNSQKPWKPDRTQTQLWSPQRSHWLVASGLTAGPCNLDGSAFDALSAQ